MAEVTWHDAGFGGQDITYEGDQERDLDEEDWQRRDLAEMYEAERQAEQVHIWESGYMVADDAQRQAEQENEPEL